MLSEQKIFIMSVNNNSSNAEILCVVSEKEGWSRVSMEESWICGVLW